ncbi:cytochrome c [Bradyrhizobium sp. SSBR45G]|uniref:c-type cytochrome n=1 Tax=unclassified Bradyrhizobium TaxID=2631580 RepID=UPI002342B248|nr:MULTISPECIES: cytochrome c [unclassified Bradyrhizobium]GLH82352.1 cytochrome c [Bradyrhizobium sp. SSBR45G]GLH89785.1 cytochrome c [Bradyrhizobium sp. SSBR45R]
MPRIIALSVLLLILATVPAAADDLDHGRQLAERWCAECHAVGTEPAKFRRARPFVAIAAKDGLTRDLLVKFLLLPHATMANNPLSPADAADLATYVLSLRK